MMRKLKCLDGTSIKLVAMVLMVVDHIYWMFKSFGAPVLFTHIGRVVFPIFLFTSAESFHYTRDRKKYLERLLLASVIMMVASTVLKEFILPNKELWLEYNAFGTFFIIGLYMLFWDRLAKGVKEKDTGKIVTTTLLCFVPVLMALPEFIVATSLLDTLPVFLVRPLELLGPIVPDVIFMEGGPTLLATGLAFHIFREERWKQMAALAGISLFLLVLYQGRNPQWLMGFTIIPLLMYNGGKGKGMKWLFYIFYPGHLYILYTISTLMSR